MKKQILLVSYESERLSFIQQIIETKYTDSTLEIIKSTAKLPADKPIQSNTVVVIDIESFKSLEQNPDIEALLVRIQKASTIAILNTNSNTAERSRLKKLGVNSLLPTDFCQEELLETLDFQFTAQRLHSANDFSALLAQTNIDTKLPIDLQDQITALLPTVIYIYNVEQGKKVLLNSQPLADWGIKPVHDGVDDWIASRVHPDDALRVKSHYSKILNWTKDEHQTIELRFRKDNGEFIWLRATDIAIEIEESGKVDSIIGSLANIDRYFKLVSELEKSNANLETILTSIDSTIWSVDRDLNLIFFNEGFKHVWDEFLPGVEKYKVPSNTRQILKNDFINFHKEAFLGKNLKFEYSSDIYDSQFYDIEIDPVYNNGNITGAVGTLRNVSGCLTIRNQLEEYKERLALTTGAAKVGIFEWDLNTNHLIWNDTMFEQYGLSPKDGVPTYKRWLSMADDNFFEYLTTTRKIASRKAPDLSQIIKFELEDGRTKFIQPTVKLYKDKNDTPLRLIGVSIDVTDIVSRQHKLDSQSHLLEDLVNHKTKELKAEIDLRILAEQELEDSLNKQLDYNTQKNAFVNMISHEFRTPLTQILMSLDILELLTSELDAGTLNKAKKYLDIQKSGIEQMVDILSITSNFFLLQEQLLHPIKGEFKIDTFLNRLVSNTINSKSLGFSRIRLTISTHDTKSYSNEDILYQAIIQIVDNALKYSDDHSEVVINLKKDFDAHIIEIIDSGTGIPATDLPFVKDLFRRGSDKNNVGSHRGLGIGLTIADLSLRALKCELHLISDFGYGTTATIKIPID